MRRSAIAFAGVMAATALGGVAPAHAANPVIQPIIDRGVSVELRRHATLPDNTFGDAPRLNSTATVGDRFFVVEERDGLVYEVFDNGTTELYFDVATAITIGTGRDLDTTNVFHGGLRSIAFHPDFDQNGRLYVSVMEERPSDPTGHTYVSDVADPIDADGVVIEFTASTNTGIVDPNSYREVLRVGMSVYDHPIKQLAFDPFATGAERGLLYIAHGDGSLFSDVAGGGQANDALGKILRVDPRQNGANIYSVPANNPFVGDPAMIDEAWSIGHRNPHQMAFARHGDGSVLIVADAGRDNVEEVNIIDRGGDYGWPQREGTFVHLESGGVINGIAALPVNEATNGFTFPAAQYGHEGSVGQSVTDEAIAGGYAIDNGSALDGQYFFADFPTTGRLFHVPVTELTTSTTTLDTNDPERDEPGELTQASIGAVTITVDHDDNPATAPLPRSSLRDVFDDEATYETTRADVRFGQGPGGELYVMSKRNNTIYLVVESIAPDDPVDPPIDPPDDEPIDVGPYRDADSLAEILAATDYRSGDADVLRLYRAYFRRDPDVVGAIYWLDIVRGPSDLEDIAASFGASREFEITYGSVDNERFLEIVYRNVLDRLPDPSGQEYWLGEMGRGVSRPRVLLYFAVGAEFVGRYPYAPIDD